MSYVMYCTLKIFVAYVSLRAAQPSFDLADI